APFAFDKAAGDFPSGVSVLTVIDRERKKCRAWFRLFVSASGDQHHCIAGADDNSAVRLFRHFARFKRYFAAVKIYFECVNHIWSSSFSQDIDPGRMRM